jgi:hypothetical protein
MHSHAVVMERQSPQKETVNKANLISKIRKCSHWCGDLISCYNWSCDKENSTQGEVVTLVGLVCGICYISVVLVHGCVKTGTNGPIKILYQSDQYNTCIMNL